MKVHGFGWIMVGVAGFMALAPDAPGPIRVRLDPRIQALIQEGVPQPERGKFRPTYVDGQGNPRYGAVVYTRTPDLIRGPCIRVHAVFDRFVTVTATAEGFQTLSRSRAVEAIETGEVFYPTNDVMRGLIGADLVEAGWIHDRSYTGKGVIVCIIDTGIDWDHPDFRDPQDPKKSRILFLWDQALTPQPGESSPTEEGAGYGVEYTRAQIEDEIDGTPAGRIRSKDTMGHGTHVAGTVAGGHVRYRGVAPGADLLIVKAGNESFFETDLINAIAYARQKAEALGRPIVVNLSLGSDAGPHDGTSPKSWAIDAFCQSGPGRVVVASAGNSGGESIHVFRTIPAGGSIDIPVLVPAYTPEAGTFNDDFECDIWAHGNGRLTARVISPAGESVSQGSDGAILNHTEQGTVYIYNYIATQNGDRQIRVSVYDGLPANAPAPGTWTIRLSNPNGQAISIHGWLFDRTIGGQAVTLSGGDNAYTLGNTAASAIIAGAFVSKWRWYASSGYGMSYAGADRSDDYCDFSAVGPTRDGRQKPDLTAPGQALVSTRSSDAPFPASRIVPGGEHAIYQGTSVSAAVVTGSVALLLERHPTATSEEIRQWLIGQTGQDSYTGEVWNPRWGFGKLDLYRAFKKAATPFQEGKREICVYDQWDTNYGYSLAANTKASLRFTPTLTGEVTGLFVHTSGTVNLTGPVWIEIWSDNTGSPGTRLGGTTTWASEAILPFTWNYIPLENQPFLTAGQNVHVVLWHASEGQTLGLLMENGLVSYRSKLNPNGTWLQHTYDFRIRPVVVEKRLVRVAAKAFLEGPYDPTTHRMRTHLAAAGVIPKISPYPEDPRLVDTIPLDVVDWVLLKLRTDPAGPSLLARSLFLRDDGRLVDTDGTTVEIPLEAPSGDYYLILKHRNHLAVMSAFPWHLDVESGEPFDFTRLENLYGRIACPLEPGIYGLYTGDASGDGQVKVEDKNDYWWVQVGRAGYWSADFNLDGQVKVQDKNDYWWKNVGLGTQVPKPNE